MALTQGCQMIQFKPQGRLDLQGGMTLGEQMSNLVPQSNDLWVIDLAEVDFMDSSGLVSLVTGLKAARESGCRLVLCNVQPPVRVIFELTQLDLVFEIFNTYEEILGTVKENNLVLAA